MYRLFQVVYACSVRRLRCLKRATSLTCSRSLRSGMVRHYIGSHGLMIDSDAYSTVIRLEPSAMIRDVLLPALLANFPNRGFQAKESPTIGMFPAEHRDVGDITIVDDDS